MVLSSTASSKAFQKNKEKARCASSASRASTSSPKRHFRYCDVPQARSISDYAKCPVGRKSKKPIFVGRLGLGTATTWQPDQGTLVNAIADIDLITIVVLGDFGSEQVCHIRRYPLEIYQGGGLIKTTPPGNFTGGGFIHEI